MRRLQRPDVFRQPRQQRHVLRAAAEKGLAQMDVTLDKAGHEEASVGVNHRLGACVKAPGADNSAVANQHGAVMNNLVVGRNPDLRVLDEGFPRHAFKVCHFA